VVYTNASACDGIPECYNREDECGAGCPIESHFCKSDITCHHEEMSAVWKRKGLIFLLKREYCNGRPRFSLACGLGFDKTNCTGRYYCNTPTKNFFSIEKLLLCDGVLDCDDGSDEWESVCNETRFYCKSKQPLSVGRERFENGIKDCSDGDECPADSKKETVFSSPLFRVILWIMGGISLLGNTSVCIISIMQVRTAKSEPLKVAFLWLVANLSVSDLLMGVYLLSVSAMGSQFSGSYCYYDAEWREQSARFLGSLAVVSTECALIMATMATIRLCLCLLSRKNEQHKTCDLRRHPIVCAWCLGILFGTLLVWLITDQDILLNLFGFRTISFQGRKSQRPTWIWLANRVHHFSDNFSNKDWFGVKDTITQRVPRTIKGEFGYFSETRVCMPRLFPKVGDASWGYSTFIIVLNFCLFVYMACCYLILYQQSRKVTKVRKVQVETVASNSRCSLQIFCCTRIPICIMAFISLAGVKLDNIVYVVCAGVLHPLNSVLNPLIYSDHAVNFMRK
uniref:G-protein coupled receptors family 1 profile domain-containing protein n=1 Tax=Ciona savignyi TaxID=51511 RepID=H2YTP9_CIOSA